MGARQAKIDAETGTEPISAQQPCQALGPQPQANTSFCVQQQERQQAASRS